MTHRPARATGRPPGAATRRDAFTLVEILVVITIIAVLMSLVVAASVGFIGQAKSAATRTTIKKVEEAILERVSSVNRWHQRESSRLHHDWQYRGWDTRWYIKGLNVFANTQSGEQAKLVLSRKGMLIELLPVNVDELKLAFWFWAKFDDPSDPAPGVQSYILIDGYRVPYATAAEQAVMNAWLTDTDPNRPGNQSLDRPGEVFYYALTNAPVYGGKRVEEDEFRPSELVDPDQDGLMEIGDAWGNPLRFYRWPTRLVNDRSATGVWAIDDASMANSNPAIKVLLPNAPTVDLKTDPDDRSGYLSVPNPLTGAPIAEFFHDANTWHTPLVVSAGADGKLGLREPNDVNMAATPPVRGDLAEVPGRTSATTRATALEEMYDNITNHSSRAGTLQ